MRVADDIGHRVDAPGRYFGGFESAEYLLDGQAAGPVGDRRIQQTTLRRAAIVVGKLGRFGQVAAADGVIRRL
jgi:hypothetical protein